LLFIVRSQSDEEIQNEKQNDLSPAVQSMRSQWGTVCGVAKELGTT